MNIPPSEAKQLTLAEYQGLMTNWNAAQGGDDAEATEPPGAEQLATRKRELEARGITVLWD